MRSIPFRNVREYYERLQPHGYWFSSKTMKLFGCRLPTVAFETTAGLLFISSELDFHGERRYYNVRRQKLTGDIETLGKFNDFRTRQEAKNYIHQLHEGKISATN